MVNTKKLKLHDKLLFGTAGVPVSSKGRSTVDGIARVRELGLDCMELEFVQGVRMGEKTAEEVSGVAAKENIALSVHGPYYINLNAVEKEKLDASVQRIYDSARIGNICSATNIVFHPAFYLKDDHKIVYDRVFDLLKALAARLEDENIPVTLRPETTGKATQFGDIDELLSISAGIDGVLPCIDFSHVHARDGKHNTYGEFVEIFEKIEKTLGKEGLKTMHCHISGIEYTAKGERNHLILEESDMNYKDLMKVFKEFKACGTIICESPNIEEDALLMKKTYEAI
ncbi:endonuclease 4 [Methanimicrococcus sp. At1]|uniref:Endonuclease 4 n=1 Tax=Methanimicrococcus hacksteinii TaxID=3028293 RepID=A0ABU3VRK6_9EURY|nr:TIM barrel protein [Methanimicrococcus sp. At1]MDV0446027.1 endonuclease 4 [Methanimicrococcus sp. At1]